MFSRSNITLYQFYSPYSVHEKLSMDSMMMRACQAGNYQDIVHTGASLCIKQALVVVHVFNFMRYNKSLPLE